MATHARTTGPVTTAIRSVEREHEPNRRFLLAGLAAAPFVPRPALASTHPDAEANRLIGRLEEEWAAYARIEHLDGEPEHEAYFDALYDQKGALLNEIDALPATGRQARLAKALALAWIEYVSFYPVGAPRENRCLDERLATDIHASFGGGVA